MAIFGKKKDKTVDLTPRYMKQKERAANIRESMKASSEGSKSHVLSVNSFSQQATPGGFGFLDSVASGSYPQTSGSQEPYNNSDDPERKKKLAKRLMDITDKLEDISNQIYHLQQRIEVLEKKSGLGG